MKFIIEVEDFWLDGEELDDALKSHLLTSVVHKISKSIEEKIDIEISKKVTEVIEKNLLPIINSKLTELVATETILRNREEISITQHIKNIFQSSQGWNGPRDQIERFSKKFCAEMKLQYDAAFATKIVMGMKDQGLLKPEVVQLLLDDK